MLEKFGIGVDVVKVSRFKNKPYLTNKNFYKKIFLDSEIKYCLKYKDPAQHFSGKLAVKESLIKSINEKILLHEIKTSYKNSKPVVNIKKSLSKKYRFIVSISHENDIAIAAVLSEKIK